MLRLRTGVESWGLVSSSNNLVSVWPPKSWTSILLSNDSPYHFDYPNILLVSLPPPFCIDWFQSDLQTYFGKVSMKSCLTVSKQANLFCFAGLQILRHLPEKQIHSPIHPFNRQLTLEAVCLSSWVSHFINGARWTSTVSVFSNREHISWTMFSFNTIRAVFGAVRLTIAVLALLKCGSYSFSCLCKPAWVALVHLPAWKPWPLLHLLGDW